MIPSHLFHPHHLCLHLWLVRKSKTFQQCFQQLTDSVQKPISTSNSSNTDLDVKHFKNESQRQTVFFKSVSMSNSSKPYLNVKQFKTLSQRQTVQNPSQRQAVQNPISCSNSCEEDLTRPWCRRVCLRVLPPPVVRPNQSYVLSTTASILLAVSEL